MMYFSLVRDRDTTLKGRAGFVSYTALFIYHKLIQEGTFTSRRIRLAVRPHLDNTRLEHLPHSMFKFTLFFFQTRQRA